MVALDIPGVLLESPEALRREAASLLGRSSTGFPGAQPVSFARRHIQQLQEADYFLCEKTDGIRCLLYLTQDEHGHEVQYFIGRKNEYYEVRGLHFPYHEDPTLRKYHVRTLLDGELVLDRLKNGEQQLRYLVFDCLAIDNENITAKPLTKRIGRLGEWIIKPYERFLQRDPHAAARAPLIVKLKQVYRSYNMHRMFHEILPNLAHGNDGLVWTREDTPYVCQTDPNILKWKPAEENTVDFRLLVGDRVAQDASEVYQADDYAAVPKLNLLAWRGGDDVGLVFGRLHVTREEWAAIAGLDETIDLRIIECYKDEQGRWRAKLEKDGPYKGTPVWRDDKTNANHISVIESVLDSISDGISKEDLLNAEPAVKAAFYKRHPEELQMLEKQVGRPAPV